MLYSRGPHIHASFLVNGMGAPSIPELIATACIDACDVGCCRMGAVQLMPVQSHVACPLCAMRFKRVLHNAIQACACAISRALRLGGGRCAAVVTSVRGRARREFDSVVGFIKCIDKSTQSHARNLFNTFFHIHMSMQQ